MCLCLSLILSLLPEWRTNLTNRTTGWHYWRYHFISTDGLHGLVRDYQTVKTMKIMATFLFSVLILNVISYDVGFARYSDSLDMFRICVNLFEVCMEFETNRLPKSIFHEFLYWLTSFWLTYFVVVWLFYLAIFHADRYRILDKIKRM